ncbi:hypothetical protein ABPG72_016942 [Tetrahymena utriculariae]
MSSQQQEKKDLNSDEAMNEYMAKRTTFLDWMGIAGMMCLTYGIIVLLLYIFTEWGANSGPNQHDLYLSCQIFNLVIFCCYLIICATLWKIFIGRREQMKQDLIKKKLEIQSKLTRKQDHNAEQHKLIQ